MDQKAAYLQKHEVPELFDSLVCKLVATMPSNPVQFLAQELQLMADSGAGSGGGGDSSSAGGGGAGGGSGGKGGGGHSVKYTTKDRFPHFASNRTVISRTLSLDVYGKFFDKRTSVGTTFDSCIQDAVEGSYAPKKQQQQQQQQQGDADTSGDDSELFHEDLGFVVHDEECYDLYGEVIEAVMAKANVGPVKPSALKHDMSVSKIKGGFQLEESTFVSASFHAFRNIKGVKFVGGLARHERRKLTQELCDAAKAAYTNTPNDGLYYVGSSVPTDIPPVFSPKPSAQNIAANREFPDGRGVWVGTSDNRFGCIVNGADDHLEYVLLAEQNGNLRGALERLAEASSAMEQQVRNLGMDFAQHKKFGTLSSSLDHLGSAMVVRVQLRLKTLVTNAAAGDAAGLAKLKDEAAKYSMRLARKPAADADTVELVSCGHFAVTEQEVVQQVLECVTSLTEMENAATS